MQLPLVLLGGAIGAGARHLAGRALLTQFGPGFPLGTLAVNVTGGLLMGVLAGVLARGGAAAEGWRLFLGTGVLGGFTTFSAFSLETVQLIERGEPGMAAGYVVLSVLGALTALAGGLALARAAAA